MITLYPISSSVSLDFVCFKTRKSIIVQALQIFGEDLLFCLFLLFFMTAGLFLLGFGGSGSEQSSMAFFWPSSSPGASFVFCAYLASLHEFHTL